MDTNDVREKMEIYGSDGEKVGVVDRVEGRSIKLPKDTPGAKGDHLYFPLTWVARVDQHVHLSKPAADVREAWQAHPVREGEE